MNIWHFEYNLEADPVKQIMFEKIYGVWRPQTALNYVRDFEKEAAKLIARPWAKLIDLSNWKTADPEVIRIIGKHLDWCRTHNMVWSANVITNPVTYSHLMRMFAKGGTKPISRTFRTRPEAERFLTDNGFKLKVTLN